MILPRRDAIALDGFVVVLTFALCLAGTLLSVVSPTWRDARANWSTLRAHELPSQHITNARLNILLIAQVALGVAAVFVTGLFVRTAVLLSRTSPGFDQEHAVLVSTRTAPLGPQATARERLTRHGLAALPYVEAAGGASSLPLSGLLMTETIDVAGSTRPAHQAPVVDVMQVTPGYFEAMGIPVIAGRTFNDDDPVGGAASPVILNEAAARLLFGAVSGVGRQLRPRRPIIGLVGNTATRALGQEGGPVLYRLHSGGTLTFVVRTSRSPDPLLREIKKLGATFDLGNASTLRE
jgi:putative ABC transport system permease protein